MIEDSVRFVYGDEQGLGVSYFKNGNKKEYGQWKNGLKYGVWRYFSNEGKLNKKGEFNQFGYREGIWVLKDSLNKFDSIIKYTSGYIDTCYSIPTDTLNLDSLNIQPFELKGGENENKGSYIDMEG